MNEEMRKRLIEAIAKGDLSTMLEIKNHHAEEKGERFVLRSFYDMLKFTGTIDPRPDEDWDKVVIEGEALEFLENLEKHSGISSKFCSC